VSIRLHPPSRLGEDRRVKARRNQSHKDSALIAAAYTVEEMQPFLATIDWTLTVPCEVDRSRGRISGPDIEKQPAHQPPGGVSNLLEVLDADRDLFAAELELAQTIRDELLTVVQLYKALGGG
jgi:hypothetical protein